MPYFLAFLDLHHSTGATKPSAVNFYFLCLCVCLSLSTPTPPPPPPVSPSSTELLPDNKRLPRRNLVVIRVRFVRYRLFVGPRGAGLPCAAAGLSVDIHNQAVRRFLFPGGRGGGGGVLA